MATEKRLIDANDVYSLFDTNGKARLHVGDIDLIPRVDAVEVVHSKWVMIPVAGVMKFRCGNINCCRLMPFGHSPAELQYCPYCGAKMDGDGND